MLEKIKQTKTKRKDVSQELEALRSELTSLENQVKGSKLPVIISFDGWSSAGKGSIISKLIKNLDPRFYNVVSERAPNVVEKRKPWLWRYWCSIPKQGEFLILDRSWYRDTVNAYMFGEINKKTCKQRLDDINVFERQLADDGYLIIKFFLHISKKEQSARIEKLCSSEITSWRIDSHDIINLHGYEDFLKQYEKMLTYTNTKSAQWNIIVANDKTATEFSMLMTVTNAVKSAIAKKKGIMVDPIEPQFPLKEIPVQKYKLSAQPMLCDVVLDKSLADKEYDKQLKACQEKLFNLQNRCYKEKVPVIICYEGWDAGGKGGNIKRVAASLDPRGYVVNPIAAPEPSELARHYLWRFWRRLENDGHFTIFDRTWYGRVMVEPIEKITSESRVNQAYNEINEFEKQLTDWGAVVIKFWINIDKDEQLKRFTERQNTPEKQWKITDEDWRNREKWDVYEKYINIMIEKTSTKFAPWTIVEGNDKKYARIKALNTIIKRLEKKLDK